MKRCSRTLKKLRSKSSTPLLRSLPRYSCADFGAVVFRCLTFSRFGARMKRLKSLQKWMCKASETFTFCKPQLIYRSRPRDSIGSIVGRQSDEVKATDIGHSWMLQGFRSFCNLAVQEAISPPDEFVCLKNVEEPGYRTRAAVVPRLVSDCQFLFFLSPAAPTHWLYVECNLLFCFVLCLLSD